MSDFKYRDWFINFQTVGTGPWLRRTWYQLLSSYAAFHGFSFCFAFSVFFSDGGQRRVGAGSRSEAEFVKTILGCRYLLVWLTAFLLEECEMKSERSAVSVLLVK